MSTLRAYCVALATALTLSGWASIARGQNNSLFRPAGGGAPSALVLSNTSWLYEGVDPPRVIKLNDLVTVMVVETSQVTSDNTVQRRKQGQLNAELSNWIRLKGGDLLPSTGDPHINGTLQGQFRAQSNLATADLLRFSIQARVVDIRPNGHLVLEGHQTMINNEEKWDRMISGIVRPEDVLPNNTILSEKVAELSIRKKEQGMARDGYRRGWLFYLIDRYGAF
jgi:flagellar L-ring protein precursor FlgH